MKPPVIVSLVLTVISISAQAKNLACEIRLNDSVLTASTVQTIQGEKVSIGKLPGISAYIQEQADDVYRIEAFLPDYEARIYSQGKINASGDQLIASLWGREVLVEVQCAQMSARKRMPLLAM